MTVNGYRVSFWGVDNVLRLTVAMHLHNAVNVKITDLHNAVNVKTTDLFTLNGELHVCGL